MYYKGVLGYESGGTSTVDDFFSREDAQDITGAGVSAAHRQG